MTERPRQSGAPDVGRRLAERGPIRFDCPMCSRVQKISLPEVRCESCGALLRVFADAEAARAALGSASARNRHLRELGGGLYVVAEL